MSEQFERRQVRKTYWACVEGTVTPAEGTWTDRLKKTYGKPRTEVVGAGDPDGREAVLHYRTLGTWRMEATATTADDGAGCGPREGSWLEVDLETGRTHQIRIQASSRGHAIVGDAFYDATTPFGPTGLEERERPIALHARRIQLKHPMTDAPLDLTAPLPQTWRELELPLADEDYLADVTA
ncbi:MAG: pseudouridine synthase [Pirellulales bacterium]